MDGRMNIKHEKVGKKDNESRDGKIHYSLARALIEMQPDKRNRLDTSSHLASKATKPRFSLGYNLILYFLWEPKTKEVWKQNNFFLQNRNSPTSPD